MTNPGIIVIWSGAIVDIPSGWVICDGNNGTPDLRNRFVVGAGDTYAVNDTGGALLHDHFFQGGLHNHSIPAGNGMLSGLLRGPDTEFSGVQGTTDDGGELPPFFALAFIMKT